MTRSARGYDRPAVGQFTVEQSSTGQAMDEQHAAGWPGFARALRAEVLKGAHAAPRKVTLIAPLPFCALGMMASGALGGEGAGGTGFATYGRNYWYVLMLPVSVVLMSSSVANLDARQGLRPVLGLPMPPARTWWAYVLELALVANLVVCAASGVTSNVAQVDDVLTAMERMRVSLRDSLEARWAAEDDRRRHMESLMHELKTPLTVIQGNAELLEGDLAAGRLSGDAAEDAREILDATHRMDESFTRIIGA